MYNCDMCNTPFETKEEFFKHPHIVQKKIVREEVVQLSLSAAASQALWDLKQWVKDHVKGCDCFTCGESIPDLERALLPERVQSAGVCC